MDDNEKLPDSAEYKFTDSEVGVGSDNLSQSAADSEVGDGFSDGKPSSGFALNLSSAKWKKIVIPGVMVLAILLTYFVFSLYSSSKNRAAEQEKLLAQEQAAMLTKQQQLAMQKVSLPVVEVASTVNNEQITQVYNRLQQKIDELSKQAENNQVNIAQVSNDISATKQDMADISQKIDILTNSVQQILAEVAKLKAPPKKATKKPKVAYNVRAIVPGRAWLQSGDGKNITLRVGDKLNGYGEVLAISPRQGMVLMSDGSVIQYGVNDV